MNNVVKKITGLRLTNITVNISYHDLDMKNNLPSKGSPESAASASSFIINL